MDKQERHYNIFKLNRVFAISSILFLLLLIWTFADDYSRSWRTYQSEFRQMEIVQTDSLLKLEEKITQRNVRISGSTILTENCRRILD